MNHSLNKRKKVNRVTLFVFCVGILGITSIKKKTKPAPYDTVTVIKDEKENLAPTTNQDHEVQFEFYDMLKKPVVEKSEDIPTTHPKQQPKKLDGKNPSTNTKVVKPKAAQKVNPISSNDVIFSLQVAAFKDYSSANSLRAKLGLQGIKSYIHKREANNTVWYKVLLGPFDNFEKASAMQTKMNTQFADSLIVKRNKGDNSGAV